MTFKPKTYPVNLMATRDPDRRMALVIAALPKAEQELGERPTHVLIDSRLRINIEPLLEMQLRVRRRPMPPAWQLVARLAVAEPEPRMAQGAPAQIPVQGRLV